MFCSLWCTICASTTITHDLIEMLITIQVLVQYWSVAQEYIFGLTGRVSPGCATHS